MSEEKKNIENETKKIEKMQEYLNSRKEIFDYTMDRKVRNSILYYLGIISLILWLGGNAYIDNKVRNRVEKRLSENIDQEYEYLSERNKITELGDNAITTKKMIYYEELQSYLTTKKPERVRTAAQAEILRISSFLSTWGYSGFSPKQIDENNLSTEQLMDLYKKTSKLNTKVTILFFLSNRHDKDTPEFLLNIANNTDNLRLRYISLCSFQILLDDLTLIDNFSTNCLDYDGNLKLDFCHFFDG